MGFDVVVFDGPGQGQAFREHGLTMSPEWEEPVGAVLDHFKIDDCTLMGFSLGGYLAPRAAAFDARIKRLIVDDVLDDFLAIHTGKMPPVIASSILKSLAAGDAEAVNATIGQLIEKREAARWTFDHGMEVSGSKDYFEYLCWLGRMQTASFSDRLSQDVLLLAAKEDHIVPLKQFFRQAKTLTNVRSLTTQLFTRVDHAHNHCHVSNSPMVVDYVLTWLGFQLRLARGRQRLQAV